MGLSLLGSTTAEEAGVEALVGVMDEFRLDDSARLLAAPRVFGPDSESSLSLSAAGMGWEAGGRRPS